MRSKTKSPSDANITAEDASRTLSEPRLLFRMSLAKGLIPCDSLNFPGSVGSLKFGVWPWGTLCLSKVGVER